MLIIVTLVLHLILALGAIASQIPSLDPFRWPGYYLIIHGGLLNIFVMLFFCEKWDDVNRKKKSDSHRKKSKKCQKPDQSVPVSKPVCGDLEFNVLTIKWIFFMTLFILLHLGSYEASIMYQNKGLCYAQKPFMHTCMHI